MWNVGICRADIVGKTERKFFFLGDSTDAAHRDGVTRSSDEASVMAVERRGYRGKSL